MHAISRTRFNQTLIQSNLEHAADPVDQIAADRKQQESAVQIDHSSSTTRRGKPVLFKKPVSNKESNSSISEQQHLDHHADEGVLVALVDIERVCEEEHVHGKPHRLSHIDSSDWIR